MKPLFRNILIITMCYFAFCLYSYISINYFGKPKKAELTLRNGTTMKGYFKVKSDIFFNHFYVDSIGTIIPQEEIIKIKLDIKLEKTKYKDESSI